MLRHGVAVDRSRRGPDHRASCWCDRAAEAPHLSDRSERRSPPVDCGFRLLGEDSFGFEVLNCVPSLPLIVDPGLVMSTFLGGSGEDYATTVILDSSDAIFVGGSTQSS